jgi:hypothetical protein
VVERSTVNRLVAGSNPAWGVKANKKLLAKNEVKKFLLHFLQFWSWVFVVA